MTFIAKYRDECQACWQEIVVGDEVHYQGDQIVHDACPEAPTIGEVCPSCFMTRSLAGTCGCVA